MRRRDRGHRRARERSSRRPATALLTALLVVLALLGVPGTAVADDSSPTGTGTATDTAPVNPPASAPATDTPPASTPPGSTPPASGPAPTTPPAPTATDSGGPASRGLPKGFAGQLEQLRQQATTLTTNLAAAQTEAGTAIAAYTDTTNQVQAAIAAAQAAQTALDAANAQADVARRAVQLVVRESYVERVPHTSAALLLTGDFDDLQFSLAALSYLNGRDTDEFTRLRAAQSTASTLARTQQDSLDRAQTLQVTADTQRAAALVALSEVSAQQGAFLAAVTALRDAAATAAGAAPLSPSDAAAYAEFLAELSALGAGATTSGTTYVAGGPGLTPLPGTAWVKPLLTYHISSCYCIRDGTFHHGVDLAAPAGTPIYAVGPGTVVAAGPAQGFGNWVVIDHHDGSFSIYGHMRVLATVVGTTVSAGTLIAYVGSEGESSGPHLHFEVRLGSYASNTASTDPVLWLAQRGVTI